MSMAQYDAFVSYSTKNSDAALELVRGIEARGYKCFIAPRDITPGALYAQDIIRGIKCANVFLFLYSADSDASYYCRSEVNSAVSESKYILTVRVGEGEPSDIMKFYLGPTQWINAVSGISGKTLEDIVKVLQGTSTAASGNETVGEKAGPVIKGPALLELKDLSKIGMDLRSMTLKEMEIDYLCIPADKFHIDDSTEGTLDDWLSGAQEFEIDTSVLLVKNDEIIGYTDILPIAPQYYPDLISGKVFIRDYMTDIFCMGGDFDVYIAAVAIIPQEESQRNYLMMFTWIFQHLDAWDHADIHVKHVGISVYSDMLEKFLVRLGFEFRSFNPGNGKVYEADIQTLKKNPFVKRIAPHLSVEE
jgi:hypothetical protein